ncbi:MAG TPA: ABC transporter permease [Cyclobacteriaceae bacterium]
MILKGWQLALRFALKHKNFSFINIAGLALGLASSIAIIHFVSSEFSFDEFHYLPDNVYRLNTVTQTENGVQVQAAATPLLAPTLMSDLPEVEAAVRLRHADDVLIEANDITFHENKVFYADSNFFKVLSFPLAQGNPNSALKEINTAVITSEFASNYFGEESPLNKTILVNNVLVKITGITLPVSQSHFKFDVLISFETFTPPKGAPVQLASWEWTSFPTYIRLKPGTNAAAVEAKFPAFISKYRSSEVAKSVNYQLQPIKEVYLHSRNILERDGITTKGDYNYMIGLAVIAALILGIACFNFINLSTALSVYRIKETGLRRTLGSSRRRIFFQFILESIVIAAFSLLLGILILQTGIAKLEDLLDTHLSLTAATHLRWLPIYIALVVVVGFLGGLYPATFLSRLKPQVALKGKDALHQGRSRFSIRKVIIVFQFFITASLIATSFTVKKQMDYLFSKDLGFDKEGVIVIHIPDEDMRKLFPALRNTLSENTIVRGVSAGRDLFDGQQSTIDVTEIGNSEKEYIVNIFRVYPHFIETMGLEMVAGRTFPEQSNAPGAFVINEAAVKLFGWDEKEVIGRKLYSFLQRGEVIGVVKDFNFSSLHSEIAPLVMFIPKTKIEYLYVRVAPGNIDQTLSTLKSELKNIAPHLPFDYLLLDQHIDEMYRQDKRFSQLAYVFCGLSVVLACLGLYGIISLMTETRVKEIGIRKVLGASVSGITSLLSEQFMLLVLFAATLALPASSWLLDRWLTNFAYRVNVSIDILILSVLLPLLLAGIAVSFKSIRAARANPVDSLRSE